MTRIEIATLACKILALWMLAQAVANLGSIVSLLIFPLWAGAFRGGGFLGGIDFLAWGVPSAFFAGQIAMSLILWFGARRLASRMVSHDPALVVGTAFTQENAMAVAFCAVGTMTLIPEIQHILTGVSQLLGGFPSQMQPTWYAEIISATLVAVISLLLIFRPSGIVRLVLLARRSGEYRREGLRCLKCGYDLRASPDRCPECGTIPPKRP